MESTLTKCVTAAMCVFIISVSSCTAHRNKVNAEVMKKAIEKGASPMEAACGLSSQVTETFCISVSAGK